MDRPNATASRTLTVRFADHLAENTTRYQDCFSLACLTSVHEC